MHGSTYSDGNRALLRSRAITAAIPEPDNQLGHRRRRGQRSGRPVNFDAQSYKDRNVFERSFNLSKLRTRPIGCLCGDYLQPGQPLDGNLLS